jgi:hypothetical protein
MLNAGARQKSVKITLNSSNGSGFECFNMGFSKGFLIKPIGMLFFSLVLPSVFLLSVEAESQPASSPLSHPIYTLADLSPFYCDVLEQKKLSILNKISRYQSARVLLAQKQEKNEVPLESEAITLDSIPGEYGVKFSPDGTVEITEASLTSGSTDSLASADFDGEGEPPNLLNQSLSLNPFLSASSSEGSYPEVVSNVPASDSVLMESLSLGNPERPSQSLSNESHFQDASPQTSLEDVKPSVPEKEIVRKKKSETSKKTKNQKKLEASFPVLNSPVLNSPVLNSELESSQFKGASEGQSSEAQSRLSTSSGDATSTQDGVPFSYDKFIQQLNIPESLSSADVPSENSLASSTPLTKNTFTGPGSKIVNQSASQSEIQPAEQGLLSASPDYKDHWQRCNFESIYLEPCTRYVP